MVEAIKSDVKPAGWMGDKRLHRLFATLKKAGGEVRVAGGAVRNWLIGEPVSDIDVATTLLPDEVMAVCNKAGFSTHPTGIDHGTITVVIDGLVVETTTLRADVETDGRRAVVAFTKDWRQDAQRRDFTINALYCDLEAHVFDETGQGLDDIKTRRIRFVGEPEQRIREDYLRILRFFRFEARFGTGREPDEKALQACVQLREGLRNISVERVQSELLKILVADGARRALGQMCDGKILPILIDTDCDLSLFDEMVKAQELLGLGRDGLLRLACLTCAADRLRLSRADEKRLQAVCSADLLTPQMSLQEQRARLYRAGPQRYRDDVAMSLARSGDASGCGGAERWRKLLALVDNWQVREFPLSGKDLLAAGFVAGKNLGDMLEKLEHEWVASDFRLEAPQLLAIAKKLQ